MALKVIVMKEPLTAVEIGILKRIGFTVLNDKLFIPEEMVKSDMSSKGRKSKRKGGKHERAIATILSEWWTVGESKDAFSKTPRSGAWKFPQDLVPPEGCPLIISCKNEESWTGVEKMLISKKHRFVTYWQELEDSMFELSKNRLFQLTTGVEASKVIPIVIFTKNFEPNYLMIKNEDYNKLKAFGGDPKFYTIKFNLGSLKGREDLCLRLMLLDDFMKWMSKDSFVAYANSV
jgi:hypothetical protein